MSSPAFHLAIDARPRGPHGPLAAEVVLGRPILKHLLEQAFDLASPGQPIAVHAREDEHSLMERLISDQPLAQVSLVTGPPRAGAATLRTDRFYDARRLRWAARTGANLETAVIWRLDRAEALAAAEDELTRRLTYQPLGRFWAFSLAERLAAALELSWVRPNVLTIAAAAFMFAAAALVAFGGFGLVPQFVTALALALALVLDTADGRLGRLQGTCSPFGRWLDHVLDELSDLALHVAIAWSMFPLSQHGGWLILGLLYLSGKYMFVIQSIAGKELEQDTGVERALPGSGRTGATRRPRSKRGQPLADSVRRLVAAMGHADIRWHLWIVLGLVGHLELALLIYAVYFPVRALAGCLRKAVVYA
jgi:phosphatidylglycerophosphate synthase